MERTKELYITAILDYTNYYKIKSLEELLHDTQAKDNIIDYIEYLKKENYSYSHQNIVKSALTHFYTINDVLLNWKQIPKFMSDRNKAAGCRSYTYEEIKKMGNATGQTYRSMIYFMSSTSVRLGALEELKVGHLVQIAKESLYQVTVYAGDKYEYKTFTTPETRQFIDEYLGKRKSDGEQITEDSPLFRVEYDPKEPNKDARAVDRFKVKGQLVRIRRESGVAPPKKVERGSKERYHKMQVANGQRKFCYNKLDEAGVSKQVFEYLVGHKQGLDIGGKHYFEPSDSRLLEEHKKAINLLTIDEQFRLQEKLDTTEKKQQVQINDLRQQLGDMRQVRLAGGMI